MRFHFFADVFAQEQEPVVLSGIIFTIPATVDYRCTFAKLITQLMKINVLIIFTVSTSLSRNCSLVFIKPHANNVQVQSFVRSFLKHKNFIVSLEGDVCAKAMIHEALLDRQYADIARRAMLLQANENAHLSSTSFIVFQKMFGLSWSCAVESNVILNAADTAEFYQVSLNILGNAWMKSMNDGKVVKLGRGFYCGLIDSFPNKPSIICINGFFAAMRAEYVTANSSVHYFLVEWDNAAMSWDEFRKKIIGVTNPAVAHPESLRSIMNSEWVGLGLDAPLDLMRNGLHASASAFEAMVERSIWLGVSCDHDKYFGVRLLSMNIPVELIEEWAKNPLVYGRYVFDHMENMGSEETLVAVTDLCHRKTSMYYYSIFARLNIIVQLSWVEVN